MLNGNIEILKSPIGDEAFSREYCTAFATKQRRVLNFLADLGDAHTTFYLIKWCVNGSRLNYLIRTTPCSATLTAA